MRKNFLVLIFLFVAEQSIAQTEMNDSVTKLLAKTSAPLQRFDILNRITEFNIGTHGGFEDTSVSLQMLRIATQLKNDSLLAVSTNIAGNYFRSKSDYPTALSYFFKALPLAQKVGDKRRISSICFDIAESYYSLQHLDECYQYAKQGEANLPARNSPMYDFMAIQFHRTMGNYYVQKNLPDSALLQSYFVAEENTRLKKPLYAMYSVLQNGSAYAELDKPDSAEFYFQKAKGLQDSVSAPLLTILFTQSYLPFLFVRERAEEARLLAKELFQTGQNVGSNMFTMNGAGFLSEAFYRLKKPDSAFYYLRLQAAMKDSLFNERNLDKIEALDFGEEIKKIDEQAREAAAKEKRRDNIQLALIGIGLLLVIITFLLLSRTVVVSAKFISVLGVITLLIVFEFLNLLLEPFLDEITFHSPALMMLAMVALAALLAPLHKKLEHFAKETLMEKNKEVRAAASKKIFVKEENPRPG